MNEYLPQHMYFSNITPPFSMNNGKIVKMNGVNYQFNLQQDVEVEAICDV